MFRPGADAIGWDALGATIRNSLNQKIITCCGQHLIPSYYDPRDRICISYVILYVLISYVVKRQCTSYTVFVESFLYVWGW